MIYKLNLQNNIIKFVLLQYKTTGNIPVRFFMLLSLHIKNLAIVDDLTIEPAPGYNAITGETGAGKSIIIGALNLVLGERAYHELIRDGCDSCSVEAEFDVSKLSDFINNLLQQNGIEPCQNNLLILKRIISKSGPNRQFINGSAAPLNLLAEIGQWLVDIHGPHDHQSLLKPVCQIDILDAFCKLNDLRKKYSDTLNLRNDLITKRQSLAMDEHECARQIDLLKFQINEIESAQLKPEEEEQLESEYNRAKHSAKLIELSSQISSILDGDEDSIISKLGSITRLAREISKLDPNNHSFVEQLQNIAEQFNEIKLSIANYIENIDINQEKLLEMEERINIIHSLKKKYGNSIKDILSFKEQAQEKLNYLENRNSEILRLSNEIQKTEDEIWALAMSISKQRKKKIPELCSLVELQLEQVGFKNCKFNISCNTISKDQAFSQTSISHNGFDNIEFLFAPNKGEQLKPLRAIASSGELARVMLAIKTVLANIDPVLVMVFDEVDANIGGETAVAIGKKMSQISKARQVICITHLATVASAAQTHFKVTKMEKNNRTVAVIKPLNHEERIKEIARMLGGESITAINHAKAILSIHNQKSKAPS